MGLDIFKSTSQPKNEIDSALSEGIQKLLFMLDMITEFGANELKALSLIQSDKYLSNLTIFLIKNKKHKSRKHSPEILKALKYISDALRKDHLSEAIGGYLPNAKR